MRVQPTRFGMSRTTSLRALFGSVWMAASVFIGGCTSQPSEKPTIVNAELCLEGLPDPLHAHHIHALDVSGGPVLMLLASTGKVALFISARTSLDSSAVSRLEDSLLPHGLVDHVVLLDADYSKSPLLDTLLVRFKVANIIAAKTCILPDYLRDDGGRASAFDSTTVRRISSDANSTFTLDHDCTFQVIPDRASDADRGMILAVLAKVGGHMLTIAPEGSQHWKERRASFEVGFLAREEREKTGNDARMTLGDSKPINFPLDHVLLEESDTAGSSTVDFDLDILLPLDGDLTPRVSYLKWGLLR
jgi:hypothetical protein